ncbi:hypothetical protein KY360_01115 [Candidatus Woesearchaeota archaeon]|nr:hypothetical protein [Candidatus Woesearchaeota archaeon]
MATDTFKILDTYGNPDVIVNGLVYPDGYFVTKDPVVAGTLHVTLCLALSLMDREQGIFSLAHILWGGASRISGERAVDILVEEIEKLGGKRSNLEAYLAGEINRGPPLDNANLVKKSLAMYDIPILGEDLGGIDPRNVYLHVPEGKIEVYRLK